MPVVAVLVPSQITARAAVGAGAVYQVPVVLARQARPVWRAQMVAWPAETRVAEQQIQAWLVGQAAVVVLHPIRLAAQAAMRFVVVEAAARAAARVMLFTEQVARAVLVAIVPKQPGERLALLAAPERQVSATPAQAAAVVAHMQQQRARAARVAFPAVVAVVAARSPTAARQAMAVLEHAERFG